VKEKQRSEYEQVQYNKIVSCCLNESKSDASGTDLDRVLRDTFS
jgi:hypothetical protein